MGQGVDTENYREQVRAEYQEKVTVYQAYVLLFEAWVEQEKERRKQGWFFAARP